MKYQPSVRGRWLPVVPVEYSQCCDCGLVHRFEFRVRRGTLEVRSERDERKTAAVRRERRKRGQ